MSGLSATVRARPDLIESAVVENKDGSITFHGYEPTRQQAAQFTAQGKLVPKGATVAAGPARPFSVTYDSSLPMQSKSLVYTASTNRTSMWAPEIEKGLRSR